MAAYPTWGAGAGKFMSDAEKVKAGITTPEPEPDMYDEVRKLTWIDQTESTEWEWT